MSNTETIWRDAAKAKQTKPTKPLHFGITLFLSYLIVCFATILYNVVWTSDRWLGVQQGVFYAASCVGFLWVFIGLPWSLLVWIATRGASDRKFRTFIALAPSWIVLGSTAFVCLLNPSNFHRKFEKITGVDISDAAVISEYSGMGGIAGSRYYFRLSASPQDTAEIIGKLGLQLTENPDSIPPKFDSDLHLLYFGSKGRWIYWLGTNAEKTEVALDMQK